MRYISLENMELSQIVLGTDGYSERIDKKTAFEIMDEYVNNGGNVIDTARLYCKGESEKYVGEFIKNRRESLYISTKCGHPPLNDMSVSRLDRKSIEDDIDESLKCLGTDYIDILWLHRDSPSVRTEDVIDTLNLMQKKGKIRHFGASNWSYKRIEEANSYALKNGLEGFIASQVLYNMATRRYNWDKTLEAVEGEEKLRYEKSHFPVFAFSSQAKGFFEKYSAGKLSDKAKDRYFTEETIKTYEKIKKESEEKHNTISYTSLDMLCRQSDFPVFPIIGPSDTKQLKNTLNIK